MATSLQNITTRIVLPLAAAVVLVASSVMVAPPAFADGIRADIYIYNDTPFTFMGITAHLDGGFGSNGSHWDALSPPPFGETRGIHQSDGSPPTVFGPGQVIVVRSESNNGPAISGTGGNIEIPGADPGTLWWSDPAGNEFGTMCGGNVKDPAPAGALATLAGGEDNGRGFQPQDCPFSFGLTPKDPHVHKATNRLDPGQGLSRSVPDNNSISDTGNNTSYTLKLGDDGNLVDIQSTPIFEPGPHGFAPHTIFIDEVVWSSHTNNASVAFMQADGNFVLLDPAGNTVWQSNTAGHPGAFVTPIGNDLINNALVPAVIGPPFGGPVWSGNNCGQSLSPAE